MDEKKKNAWTLVFTIVKYVATAILGALGGYGVTTL